MPEEPIKFRCFQCNRLLGVSRSKAGSIVHCPKCRAELIVPEPVTEAGSETAIDLNADSDPMGLLRSLRTEPDGVSTIESPPVFHRPPSGLAEPESADVGAAFSFLKAEGPTSIREGSSTRRERPAEPAPLLPTGPPPAAAEPPVRRRPEPAPAPPAAPPSAGLPSPAPIPAEAPAFPAIRMEAQPLRDEPPPLIPPVRVEPPGPIASVAPPARRNDVVLPRTSVVLWTFTMLLAVVFAFGAGLLAGHFLWTGRPDAVASNAPAPPAPTPKAE